MRQGLFYLLLASVLVGCTSIPISSFSKLSGLRPDTAMLEEFQVAVRAPEDYRLYRDGATLTSTIESPLYPEPRSIELRLIPSTAPFTPFLEEQQKRGYRIVVFEVDPEDAAAINAFREEVVEMIDKTPPGESSFTTNAWAKGCLTQGANPFQDLRLALYLRPEPNEDFFTLFKGTKIGTISEGAAGAVCTEEDEPNLLWTVD